MFHSAYRIIIIVPQWHYIDELSNDSVESYFYLQPITKLYLLTIELKLRDDFRCFRSKMCFRTFSTVPLNSPIVPQWQFPQWQFRLTGVRLYEYSYLLTYLFTYFLEMVEVEYRQSHVQFVLFLFVCSEAFTNESSILYMHTTRLGIHRVELYLQLKTAIIMDTGESRGDDHVTRGK